MEEKWLQTVQHNGFFECWAILVVTQQLKQINSPNITKLLTEHNDDDDDNDDFKELKS